MMDTRWSPAKSAPRFPESGPDFAKSAQRPKSGIWLFESSFNGLESTFQISETTFRNLLRNLDFTLNFNGLEQIPDFGFSSLKGRCHPLKPGVAPTLGTTWWDDS